MTGVPDAITITDATDDRIADYRALTDLELRTRWEPPHGLFIAEGELVLRRALRAGYRLRSVLVDAKRTRQVADLIAADTPPVAGDPPGAGGPAGNGAAPVYAASQQVLDATTGFHVHRGVLASFHRRELTDAASVL